MAYKVSIVMPAYNCGQFVRQAMDSLLSQTYSDFVILVADDASTDDTKAIIDSYSDSRIRRFHNKINMGYLVNCNLLFGECTGEYVTFQDADDWSEPDRLKILVGMLDDEPKLYAVGSCVNKTNQKSVVVGQRSFPLTHGEALKLMSNRGKAACVGSVMFRREVLESIGTYREYFDRKCFEHVDWLYRVMEKYKFENSPLFLYNYRNNPNSLTSNFNDDKIVLREIVHILGEQRRETGSDMLMDGKQEELKLVQDGLAGQMLEGDPFHFTLIRINRALLNGNKREFWQAMTEILKPFQPRAYLIFCVSVIKYTLGIKNYYKLRTFLGGARQ